ncbi:MAG: hypothetical protein U0794_13135 [Isosphaeraceae bacterium]
MKAELDSQRSFYDGMIERGEEPRARLYVITTIAQTERKLHGHARIRSGERRAKSRAEEREDLVGGIDGLRKKREVRRATWIGSIG